MMNNNVYGPLVWLHIHWVFVGLALFGTIAAFIWLSRHSTKESLRQIVWLTLVIGIVGLLLTAGLGIAGWRTIWEGHHGYGNDMGNMMKDMQSMMKDHVK